MLLRRTDDRHGAKCAFVHLRFPPMNRPFSLDAFLVWDCSCLGLSLPLTGGMMAPIRVGEMRADEIEAVGIEGNGSLWVKPATSTFPFIYREAMEVHWVDEGGRYTDPRPEEGHLLVGF